MSNLDQIIRMNREITASKTHALARATNRPKGHPKDAEKGRVTLSDRVKKSPAGACRGLDKLRESCNLG